MAKFAIVLSLCSLFLTVQAALFRNTEEAVVPAVKAAERTAANIEIAQKAVGIETVSSPSAVKRSLYTWGTCSSALYTCPSGQTCCGNSTGGFCYSGTGDVCCNYLYACPSTTPVCCNNGYCCQSGYTCTISGSSTTCTKPSTTSGCFAGYETVQMESGSVKALKEVVVGDRILSYSAKQNEFVFSPVVALLGRNPDGNTEFSELWTADGESLALTPDHLVQAGSCEASASSSFALKQAKKVVVGECLASVAGPKKVVAISTVESKGAFSVVTNHDYVVISGVVASPFSVNHAVPDLFYSVHRYLFQQYPQWMQAQAATSSSTLQLAAAVLSYFADASRPLLGAF